MAVPRFEPIATDRLLIRPMTPADADDLWRRRNDASTAEFQSWTLPYARESAMELVAETAELEGVPPEDGWMQLAVDDVHTGVALGDLAVGLTYAGRCAEMGWTIDVDSRGRGIATEAATVLTGWLFDTVGVVRVAALMHPDNLASVRVAERLGMAREGLTRNSCWVGDVNSDDLIYGMTPEMWRDHTDRMTGANT